MGQPSCWLRDGYQGGQQASAGVPLVRNTEVRRGPGLPVLPQQVCWARPMGARANSLRKPVSPGRYAHVKLAWRSLKMNWDPAAADRALPLGSHPLPLVAAAEGSQARGGPGGLPRAT